MPKDLTQIAIERLKPSTARAEFPDGAVRGLRLVIQPSGHKAWAVRYRKADGKPAKVTLGPYPALDLKSARAKAREALGVLDQGKDPSEAKKAARAAAKARAKPAPTETTGPAITSFITRHAKVKNRETVWREAERILNRELEPWRDRRLADIQPADIHDILDGKIEGGAPISANRTLAVLRRFFRWAVERQIIATSPCAAIGAPAPTKSRDRVLDDMDLARVLEAAELVPHPFGPIVRLLILTAQRRGEVAGIEWSELDLDAGLWTIPAAKAKNGKAHIVHLAAPAIEILRDVERDVGKVSRFVFGQPEPEDGSSARPPSGFSKAQKLESMRCCQTILSRGSSTIYGGLSPPASLVWVYRFRSWSEC